MVTVTPMEFATMESVFVMVDTVDSIVLVSIFIPILE